MNLQQEMALHALACGARTLGHLRSATRAVAWPVMRPAVQALIERGLVRRGRGTGIWLTAAGQELVEPVLLAPMEPYVPPAPARHRPGADDWQRLPSLAGGALWPRGAGQGQTTDRPGRS